jgi:Predicted Zn-dependent peptidases
MQVLNRITSFRIWAAAFALAFVLGLGFAYADTKPAQALASDPQVKTGSLANGLSYSLRANDQPKGRLFLSLVVKAGSLEERDDERGVAHFLEHMAFNGTKSFPKNELVHYMESIGMQFGAEVNASTTFESTRFDLVVPTDDPAQVAKAFSILREWSDGISLEKADIEAERGVVLEEERLGRGAQERLWRKHSEALYGGSRYASRAPIGTAASIAKIDQAKLKKFYATWYRPELMRVVAVGDYDAGELAKMVSANFSSLKASKGPALESRKVPERKGLRTSPASDPELTQPVIEVAARVPYAPPREEAAYIQSKEYEAFASLLSARLSQSVSRAAGDAPGATSSAFAVLGENYALLDAAISYSGAKWREALDYLRADLALVAKSGFLPSEVAQERKNFLASFDSLVANGRESSSWVDTISSCFVDGMPVVADKDRQRYYEIAFDRMTADRCKELAGLFLNGPERFALLDQGEAAGALPAAKELADAANAKPGWRMDWTETKASALMPNMPTPVAAASEREEAGVLDLKYPNGIRVLIKKTDFKPDEIWMTAVALRGIDSVEDSIYPDYLVSTALIPGSGFAELSAGGLQAALAGVNVGLQAGILDETVSLQGSSDKAGLESLLQLMHRSLTDPAVDPGYVAAVKSQLAERARNFSRDPQSVFSLELNKRLYPDNAAREAALTTEADAQALDAEKIRLSFLKQFSPTEGLVVAFSGSVDDRLRALCDLYLGSLPAKPAPETLVTGRRLKAGAEEATLLSGVDDKATVALFYKTPESDVDPVTIDGLDIIAAVISKSMRERIREDEGGSYDPSAMALTDWKKAYSFVSLSFGTSPKRAAELTKAAKEEVAKIASSGADPKILADTVLAARKSLEENARRNDWWSGELAGAGLMGYGLDVDAEKAARLDQYTPEWTATAGKRYLAPENLAVYTLLPAKK